MLNRRRTTQATAAGVLALVLALGSLASTAGARTYLNPGDGHTRYKPHRLVGAGSGIACGAWNAKRLRWRHWGQRTARATGTLLSHSDERSCAGPLNPERARIRF